MSNDRRHFNESEKRALYIGADGRCENCGVDLGAGWHGDHTRPYSAGGETDVLNGQALCPRCNLRKGSKMVSWQAPEWFTPRDWQKEAKEEVMRTATRGDRYALVDVAPGGGKTIFALWIASLMRQQGLIEKLCIVVPSLDLKVQWRDVAHDFGINLTTQRIVPAEDEDGSILTYQALSDTAVPMLRRVFQRALVVGDEIHRAGSNCDDVVWGQRFEAAFEQTRLPLLMSGTPIRPPGKGTLPFVGYREDERGALIASTTYSHGYAKCLADECVRELIFPSYDGEVEWFDWSEWDRLRLTFEDDASEEIAARRYQNALIPGGRLLPGIIAKADRRLSDIRRYEHDNAGGILLAKDQRHAELLSKILRELSGEAPALVISNNENAAEELKDFRRSRQRWLVAVNKISEGVDIPRLRVEVYATDIRQEVPFRQRSLRVGRYLPTSDLPKSKNRRGYVFLIADKVLLGFAASMKEERLHALQLKQEREDEQENGQIDEPRLDMSDLDTSVFTSDPEDYITITPERELEPEEVAYAERLRREMPGLARFTPEDIVEILKANAETLIAEDGGSSNPPPEPGEPLEERKSKKRKKLAKLVGQAANKTATEYSHVNRELNDLVVRPERDAYTEPDLDEAYKHITSRYDVQLSQRDLPW